MAMPKTTPCVKQPVDPRRDALWLALDGSARALERTPKILREKEHRWSEGLNADTINRLAKVHSLRSRLVFAEEQDLDGERVLERRLRVFHPNGRESVTFQTWASVSYSMLSPIDLTRAASFLIAWRDDRYVQIISEGEDWFVLEVLSGSVGTTLLDEVEGRDHASTLAAQLCHAANAIGLVPLSATNADLARTVAAWLVTNRGLSGEMARRRSVALCVDDLRAAARPIASAGAPDQGDGEPKPTSDEIPEGTYLLDLDADNSHVLLNNNRLVSHRDGERQLTEDHAGVRAIFGVLGLIPMPEIVAPWAASEVRKVLRGSPHYVKMADKAKGYQLTPPITPTRRLRKFLENQGKRLRG